MPMLIDTQGKSMPAALERKLKRQAAADPDIKDKDAYVYGTLRKTGWKPSTQKKKTKKMNDPSETINFAGIIPDPLRVTTNRIVREAETKGTPFFKRMLWGQKNKGPVQDYIKARQYGKTRGWTGYNDSSKLIRLAQIDNRLDSIVRFAYDDDDDTRTHPTWDTVKGVGLVGGAAAGAYGGTLAHQAVQAGGGYGAQLEAAQKAFGRGLRGTQLTGVKAGPGRFLGQYAGKGTGALKDLLSKIPGLKLSSRERMIRFEQEKEPILQPFGAEEKSKIAQEQFPAGLSPAAALKLPFPELMKLLKQRNILQQQFSKLGKLIELNSNLENEIQFAGIPKKGIKFKGAVPSFPPLKFEGSEEYVQGVRDIASGKRPRPASHIQAAKQWLKEQGL